MVELEKEDLLAKQDHLVRLDQLVLLAQKEPREIRAQKEVVAHQGLLENKDHKDQLVQRVLQVSKVQEAVLDLLDKEVSQDFKESKV
jgi:hypothetical protein